MPMFMCMCLCARDNFCFVFKWKGEYKETMMDNVCVSLWIAVLCMFTNKSSVVRVCAGTPTHHIHYTAFLLAWAQSVLLDFPGAPWGLQISTFYPSPSNLCVQVVCLTELQSTSDTFWEWKTDILWILWPVGSSYLWPDLLSDNSSVFRFTYIKSQDAQVT